MDKDEIKSGEKIIKVALLVNCILILLLPISITFNPEFDEPKDLEGWELNYLYDEIEQAFLFTGYVILIFSSMLLKSRVYKNICLFLAAFVSILFFLSGLVLFSIPIQDFIPGIGTYVYFLLFPLTSIWIYLKMLRIKVDFQEDVLDAYRDVREGQ